MTVRAIVIARLPYGKPWQSRFVIAKKTFSTKRLPSLNASAFRLAMTMKRIGIRRSLKCYGILQKVEFLFREI